MAAQNEKANLLQRQVKKEEGPARGGARSNRQRGAMNEAGTETAVEREGAEAQEQAGEEAQEQACEEVQIMATVVGRVEERREKAEAEEKMTRKVKIQIRKTSASMKAPVTKGTETRAQEVETR